MNKKIVMIGFVIIIVIGIFFSKQIISQNNKSMDKIVSNKVNSDLKSLSK